MKYSIGDHVCNGYLAKIVGTGVCPDTTPCPTHRGKPGYAIRFYEIDGNTFVETGKLEKICWPSR